MELLSKRLVYKKEFLYDNNSELTTHYAEMLTDGWIARHYLSVYDDEVRYIWVYEKELEM
jgi:hypothetical protein